MNIIKKIAAHLGLIKLVWLRDYDGKLTLSIKRKHPFGGFHAYRFWFIDVSITLHDNGTCSGREYVTGWVDYRPNQVEGALLVVVFCLAASAFVCGTVYLEMHHDVGGWISSLGVIVGMSIMVIMAINKL